ncbi:ABC transporter ATP-binding protein [Pararhizobium arenae]|uniref:ABC transporter ATP-binding protein n=1 Tax=Pararhizobium arenae TaxID=1856850 RepID=UPI00094ADEE8|nr:ABC transporter ATP-binding protein [Pararhizobium arenae]
MIEATNIRAGYGDGADILTGISLTANRREIVTILGPNGCGKSTLLKTIAGYVRPRAGTITFDGTDVASVPIHEKVRHHKVGYVPQTDNVFGTLSVSENIMLGARLLGRQEKEKRFDALMRQYPALASKKNRKASALSGGERQILSLSRALMAGPEILLLDEPSAGLSPLMMHEVFDAIAVIRDTENLCILMVEQNAFEALGIADRAYVLSLGQVALTASARDLLDDPAMRKLYLGAEIEPAA